MTDTTLSPVNGLLRQLQVATDDIARDMVTAYIDQIPEYAQMPEAARNEVRRISRANLDVWLSSVAEQRPARPDELAQFTASARSRARARFPLESLLHAYRIGGTVLWAALRREIAGGSQEDLTAGLDLAEEVLRYVDQVSTAVAQAYLDEREELITTEERHHRQLIDLLLDEGPSSVVTEERAAAGGLTLAESYWVITVVVPDRRQVRTVIWRLRTVPTEQSVIAITTEHNILMLWPASADSGIQSLRRTHQALAAEDIDTLFAVAGPATRSLRTAAEESKTVAALSPDLTGIVRLDDLPLRALIQQSGARVREIVRDLVTPLLTYDQEHGADLAATLDAFIDSGASPRTTATRLYVHRNTVSYRLNRIASLTGLDPHQPRELFLLYAGLELTRHPGPAQ